MKTITILLSVLIFSACSTKIEYIEPKCFEFKTVKQPKPRNIQITKSSESRYINYISEFRQKIDFMNSQITKYKTICEQDLFNE